MQFIFLLKIRGFWQLGTLDSPIWAFGCTLDAEFSSSGSTVLKTPIFFSQEYPEKSLGTLGIQRAALTLHTFTEQPFPIYTCALLSLLFPKHLRKLLQSTALPCSFDNALILTDDTHAGAKPVIFTLSQKAWCSCHNLSVVRTKKFVVGVKIFFCYRIWHV